MAKLLLLTDSAKLSVAKLTSELAGMGHQVRVVNLGNEPLNPGLMGEHDLVVFTSINPYIALAVALVASNSINNAEGIINALSIPKLLKEQGIEYSLVAGDEAVKAAFTKGPYYFNTAWSLGLGGFVDTVEGARSILEYRQYMKNPLSLASVLARVGGEETRVFATVNDGKYGGLMRRLNLQFAELTVVNGVIVEANPTPEVPMDRVRDVAELISNYVR